MDDYKRELLMRIRDRLLDPDSDHPSICYGFLQELSTDGANFLTLRLANECLSEMQELFDGKTWYCGEDKYCDNDDENYWWHPYFWVKPRIAMIDFLLNNR